MYPEDLVEHLLPAIWDSTYAWGLENPVAADPDMPKMKYTSPKEATTWWCHLIDIGRAWDNAGTTLHERRSLYLHYCQGWTQDEIAELEQVSQKTINKRLKGGLTQLTAFLNDTGV